MANTLYVLYLADYALPGICDGDKKYFGTKDDFLNYYLNARKTKVSGMNLNTLYAFINQGREIMLPLTYNNHVLGERATILKEQDVTIDKKEWTHINTWGFDYNVKFDKCEVSVLWIKYNRKYYRCIKPDFLNLMYKGDSKDKYVTINHFWGQPGYFGVDGDWLKSSMYVLEKRFNNKQELFEDFEQFYLFQSNFLQ